MWFNEYFKYWDATGRRPKRYKLDAFNEFLYDESIRLGLPYFYEYHPTKGRRRKSHKRIVAGILTEQMKRGY